MDCTFEELISLAENNNNIYENDKRIYLPVGYLFNKNLYEKYFDVKLEIDDQKDYFYAFFLSTFYEPLMNVYKKINDIKPNVLTKSIHNAMLAINAQKLIFDDKLDKGIVIKKVTKNKDGEIVDVEFEELDGMSSIAGNLAHKVWLGMYENIYGRKEFK